MSRNIRKPLLLRYDLQKKFLLMENKKKFIILILFIFNFQLQ